MYTAAASYNGVCSILTISSNPKHCVNLIHYVLSIFNLACIAVCRYDSETANCFTFVLFCLKSFGCYKHSSETDFLTEVVLPHTAKAAKYISLYRRLVSSGGTLVNSDDT